MWTSIILNDLTRCFNIDLAGKARAEYQLGALITTVKVTASPVLSLPV